MQLAFLLYDLERANVRLLLYNPFKGLCYYITPSKALLYNPFKACNRTGYVSNLCLHNQKIKGMIDPNNKSDPVIKAKQNAIQRFARYITR